MNTIQKCKNQSATVIYKNTTKEEEQKEKEGEEEKEEICYNLAGPIEGTNESKNEWEELKDGNDTVKGLKISLSQGELCPFKEGEHFKLTYEIECNYRVAITTYHQ